MARRFKQLARGLLLIPKQTRSTSTRLWVGACLDAAEAGPADRLAASVVVDGRPPEPVELVRYDFGRGDDGLAFYHGHAMVSGLTPGTLLHATATLPAIAADLDATCHFKTLPAALTGDAFRIVAASCFDLDTDAKQQVPQLCARLFRDEFPDMTVALGDQVYLDAPWRDFRRRTRRDPRHFYLTKYWSAWGRGDQRHEGLHPLLASGGNWFLPDDHEFWNNFPHATPLALHSFSNWRHIIRDRVRRTWHWFRGRGAIPESLVTPPSPSEWSTWSRAAYELFASFQTPAADGAVSAGQADADQQAPPPRSELLQHVDVDTVRLVMVDTRTQRSRSARAGRSAFVPPAVLDELIELAAGPDIVVLVLAQPVFKAPTDYRGLHNQISAFLDFDRGMENYRNQYPQFWRRLHEARAGRPTVLLGGDVHYNEISLAPNLAMVEVVSSPMSLVDGLATLNRLKRLFTRPSLAREAAIEDFVEGVSGPIERLVHHEREGLTTLDLFRLEPDRYALQVRHHPRDDSAPSYDHTLTIEPHHPDVAMRVRVGDAG